MLTEDEERYYRILNHRTRPRNLFWRDVEYEKEVAVHMSGQPGFASALRAGKKAIRFTPSDKQLATARSRMIGALHKHHGMITVTGDEEAIRFFCRKVFNRGRELGDIKRGHFETTIRVAYSLMKKEGHLQWCERGLGTPIAPKQRRSHSQKYTPRQQRSAA